MRRNSKSDAASSSQVVLKDTYLGGLMDTATGDVDFSESETGSEEDVTGRPVAYKTATGEHRPSSKSDCQGGPKTERT